MNAGVLAGILIAGTAALISLLAFVASSRANKVQADSSLKAIDAGAYERARLIWESSLHQLEVQVARLQEQCDRMSHQLDVSEGTITDLRGTISDLRSQLTTLQVSREKEIEALREQLAARDRLIQELQAARPRGNL